MFTLIYGSSISTLIYKFIKLKLLKEKKEKELKANLENEKEQGEERAKPKILKPKSSKLNCTIEKDENDDVYLCCESPSQPNVKTRRIIKSATPFQIN